MSATNHLGLTPSVRVAGYGYPIYVYQIHAVFCIYPGLEQAISKLIGYITAGSL